MGALTYIADKLYSNNKKVMADEEASFKITSPDLSVWIVSIDDTGVINTVKEA